jgi:hypothetical protein
MMIHCDVCLSLGFQLAFRVIDLLSFFDIVWDIDTAKFSGSSTTMALPKPFSQIKHNCQTVFLSPLLHFPVNTFADRYCLNMKGKWLTILRAQWTPNPDVYPHFTVGASVVYISAVAGPQAD